jgi:hypothetical protein
MTEPKTKWIVELQPGLYLKYGPIRKYSMTTKWLKANRYDTEAQAKAELDEARQQERCFAEHEAAEIVEVTE